MTDVSQFAASILTESMLRHERQRLAHENDANPSDATTARILELDWKIAAIPAPPLTGGALAEAMEADQMAIRDGFNPWWP